MITVDCAGDTEIVKEITAYFQKHGIDAKYDEALVITNGIESITILESFLKDTGRKNYKIRKLDSTSLLLSKEVPIEDFGFFRCEMCGYVVSSEEELLIHRRAHGIQLL